MRGDGITTIEDHDGTAPAARRRIETLALQALLIGGFLLPWEYAADRWVPKLLVSRPSDIWAVIVRWSAEGTYAKRLAVTLYATAGDSRWVPSLAC